MPDLPPRGQGCRGLATGYKLAHDPAFVNRLHQLAPTGRYAAFKPAGANGVPRPRAARLPQGPVRGAGGPCLSEAGEPGLMTARRGAGAAPLPLADPPRGPGQGQGGGSRADRLRTIPNMLPRGEPDRHQGGPGGRSPRALSGRAIQINRPRPARPTAEPARRRSERPFSTGRGLDAVPATGGRARPGGLLHRRGARRPGPSGGSSQRRKCAKVSMRAALPVCTQAAASAAVQAQGRGSPKGAEARAVPTLRRCGRDAWISAANSGALSRP